MQLRNIFLIVLNMLQLSQIVQIMGNILHTCLCEKCEEIVKEIKGYAHQIPL